MLPSPFLIYKADISSSSAKETQKTYMALKQPPYRPPPQVFGPAWTLLYGLMGFAAYRVSKLQTILSSYLLPHPVDQISSHSNHMLTFSPGL
jgi:tryptophan-rich sensory protein